MKKQEKRQEESGNQWINTMCELLKGGVLAGVMAMLSLLICAVLVSTGILPEQWMQGVVLAVCIIGALVGGLFSVGKVGSRTLLVGLGVGIVLFLLLLSAGMLAFDTTSIEHGGSRMLCACLCGGAIAGILGRGTKKKRRR